MPANCWTVSVFTSIFHAVLWEAVWCAFWGRNPTLKSAAIVHIQHCTCFLCEPFKATVPCSFQAADAAVLQNTSIWIMSYIQTWNILSKLRISITQTWLNWRWFTISPGLSANPPVSSSWQAKIKQRSFSLSIQCNLPIIFRDARTHHE